MQSYQAILPVIIIAGEIINRNNKRPGGKLVIEKTLTNNSLELSFCVDDISKEYIKVTHSVVDNINVWTVVTRFEQPIVSITEKQVSSFTSHVLKENAATAFRIRANQLYDAYLETEKERNNQRVCLAV